MNACKINYWACKINNLACKNDDTFIVKHSHNKKKDEWMFVFIFTSEAEQIATKNI